jgi:RNA polymerase sigma-70 factor (ECF subfamily)
MATAVRDVDFSEQLIEAHRAEIRLHCYRMTGSLQDAEDLVQETFLHAWRSWSEFEGRSSSRTWLYRIATNLTLNFLHSRDRLRRSLPAMAGLPAEGIPTSEPRPREAWVDPYPDAWLESIPVAAPGPEARYELAEGVRLAFVAAIQHLPPRQRAMLVLRDVLGYSAHEAAGVLGLSVAAANSALQRARETLGKQHVQPVDQLPTDLARRRLLDRYIFAWENDDVEALVSVLQDDAVYSMPPWPQWYTGPSAIGAFHLRVWSHYAGQRLVSIGANGQTAFAMYARGHSGETFLPHSIQLLTLSEGGIRSMTCFVRPTGPELFPAFGLPEYLEPELQKPLRRNSPTLDQVCS